MADDPSGVPAFRPHAPRASLALTRTEFDELSRELGALRDRHEVGLSERLRDARAYGSSGDNEDVLAVQALLGASPGQVVRVELPDGRSRALRVVGVTPPAGMVAAARPGAEAA